MPSKNDARFLQLAFTVFKKINQAKKKVLSNFYKESGIDIIIKHCYLSLMIIYNTESC